MKKLLLLALVAGGVTYGAPSASACHMIRPYDPQCWPHAFSGCGFNSVAQETVTGGQDTFTGAAYGYAVFADQGTHTMRCYVTVDGSEQSSTPTASGTGFVVAAGQVTYNAADGQAVDLCTEIDGVTVECGPADTTTFPPPQVVEALDTVFALLDSILIPIEQQLDPTICTVLAAAAPGIPGVIDVTPEGDTTIAGVPTWDCPPYGNLFPPS